VVILRELLPTICALLADWAKVGGRALSDRLI
jgi:hypothetical protein